MSNPENFLTRWSRRKQAAEQAAEEAAKEEKAAHQQASTSPSKGSADAEPSAASETPDGGAEFDVTKLPPIESIGAESDIRAFLAPGVPPELARAALRRTWSADPRIRDFIGLSENAWDFTAPDGLPGFGPLEMTDELRRQVAQMVGRSLGEAAKTPEASASGSISSVMPPPEKGSRVGVQSALHSSPESRTGPEPPPDSLCEAKAVDLPHSGGGMEAQLNDRAISERSREPGDTEPPAPRRRHGRALPE
jgi:Protein of unknown function (DUF3306)